MILLYSSRKQISFFEIRHFWKKKQNKNIRPHANENYAGC